MFARPLGLLRQSNGPAHCASFVRWIFAVSYETRGFFALRVHSCGPFGPENSRLCAARQRSQRPGRFCRGVAHRGRPGTPQVQPVSPWLALVCLQSVRPPLVHFFQTRSSTAQRQSWHCREHCTGRSAPPSHCAIRRHWSDMPPSLFLAVFHAV